jgi:flagellin-specific chaperone FliS
MLIAKEKRESNIAEYVLYMWQVEDLIRAYHFNMDLIEEHIISQFKQPEKTRQEIRNWYANIIVMMHEEGIRKKGHLIMVKDVIKQMNVLHLKLLHQNNDGQYLSLFNQAKANISELKNKLPNVNTNDIETCLDGLYGLLLLRLKGIEINKETETAMQTFSNLLAMLALRFKQIEDGELNI